MEEATYRGDIDFSGLKDEKSIEKARLRLELQHRRKVQKLRQRLENRKRTSQRVEMTFSNTADTETAVAKTAVSAASASRIARHDSDLSKLIDSTALEAPPPKNTDEIGLTAKEMSEMKLQDRLRDRQIQMLKQKQAKRKKETTRHSSEEVVRRSTFGAAGARQMGTRSKSYEPSTQYASDKYKIFTIHDFDNLEDEDFDCFLDAATSQKELDTFESLYGHIGSSHATSTKIMERPKDSVDIARKPKSINRQSSFASELDDLLRDVL